LILYVVSMLAFGLFLTAFAAKMTMLFTSAS
jgi:hypothetical protein